MIKSIQNKIHQLKRWKEVAPSLVLSLVRNKEEDVLTLIVEDQMFREGVDGEGNKIRPAYTASTVRIKRGKGQPTNRVTLRDEGDFHRSVFLYFEDDRFFVFSDDPKAKYLFSKYGDDVLGLSDESIERIINWIRIEVEREFKRYVI